MQSPFPPQPPLLEYRLPGDRWTVGSIIAWIVILISTAIIGVGNFSKGDVAPASTQGTHVGLAVELMGRYGIALHTNMPAGKPDTITPDLLTTLDKSAATPVDRLASVTIVAELRGSAVARDRLAAMKDLPRDLAGIRDSLKKLYSEPSAGGPSKTAASQTQPANAAAGLSAGEKQELIDRLGWCGKIATVYGKPATDPERAAMLAAANRTLALIVGAAAGIGGAMLTGVVLLIYLLVRRGDNRLPFQYQPPHINPGPLIEAFAIYVGSFALMTIGAGWIHRHIHGSENLRFRLAMMLVPTILAIIWPVLRGVDVGAWRNAIGWHGGKGPLREMALGFVGYLAGLPILAIGFLVTAYLIKLADAHPSHPIEKMLGGKVSDDVLVYVLAGLYAPITEETMFRGSLFSSLRIRHGWLLTALITSFLFAAIHPQGWTTIPVLMSIAIVLAGIREWRGTILSSATAHLVHNSLIVTFAIYAMT